jgi:N-acetylglutamate synthase-like GNAT family acetyltransferase
MRIDYLDQHREHVATLAAWHHAEWGHLYDHWTLDVARDELAEHAQRRSLPTTLVLIDNDKPIGSVSLVLEDAPEFNDEGSPWLASLFVVPEMRGRGLGVQLVQAAVETAARENIAHLFLFTPDHASFYQRLGWRLITRTSLKGTPVDLMEIEPLKVCARVVDASAREKESSMDRGRVHG